MVDGVTGLLADLLFACILRCKRNAVTPSSCRSVYSSDPTRQQVDHCTCSPVTCSGDLQIIMQPPQLRHTDLGGFKQI